MSWRLEWGGKATDFAPELLRTEGKPGPAARIAVDLLWEGAQRVGEHTPSAWVRLVAKGTEDRDNPGEGSFSIDFRILGEEPSAIQKELERQQPIDLKKTSGEAAPFANSPERGASEPGGL